MRTASMVLGIVGGALAILLALALIFGGAVFMDLNLWGGIRGIQPVMTAGGLIILISGVIAGIGGVLGLVGGIIVKNKNIASGVMMIIAAALSLLSFFNFLSMILFILGAIFALTKEKPAYPQYAPVPPGYGPAPYGQPPLPYGPPPVYGQIPPADRQTPPENPPTPSNTDTNDGESR